MFPDEILLGILIVSVLVVDTKRKRETTDSYDRGYVDAYCNVCGARMTRVKLIINRAIVVLAGDARRTRAGRGAIV